MAAAQRSLHQSIDDALASSFRHERRSRSTAFVAHITLVKGIPFYGYHVGYRLFFKIYLLNPSYTLRLAELLRRGAVLGRQLQPYESHLQYRSQWMIDYNLYGCAYINCKKVLFRAPLPAEDKTKTNPRWTDRSIPPHLVLDSPSSSRQSYCELEVDVHVQDILNRHDIKERPLHHDLNEWNMVGASEEKLVPSLASLWQEEAKRRRELAGGIPTVSPFSTGDLVPMSAGQRSDAGNRWIHEDEHRARLHETIADYVARVGQPSLKSIRNTMRAVPFLDSVTTVFASVADLFPENISSQQSAYSIPTASTEGMHEAVEQDDVLPSWALDQKYKMENEAEGTMGENSPGDDDDEEGDLEDQSTGSQQSHRGRLRHHRGRPPNIVAKSSHTSNHRSPAPGSHNWRSSATPSYSSQEALPIEKLRKMGVYHINDEIDPNDGFLQFYVQNLKRKRQEDGLVAPESSKTKNGSPDSTQSTASQKPYHPPSSRHTVDGKIPFAVTKGVYSPVKARKRNVKESFAADYEPPAAFSQQSRTEISDVDRLHSQSTITGSAAIHTISTNFDYASSLKQSFNSPPNERSIVYLPRLPSVNEVLATMAENSRPSAIYQDPFYSNDDDVPTYKREYAGKDLCRETNSVYSLPPFNMWGPPDTDQRPKYTNPHFNDILELANEDMRQKCSLRVWEFMPTLPTREEVIKFFDKPALTTLKRRHRRKAATTKPIEPTVPEESVSDSAEAAPRHQYDQLRPFHAEGESIMSLEVHVNTRHYFVPDPEKDEIQCIFLAIQHIDSLEENNEVILVVISQANKIQRSMLPQMNHVLFEEATELDVINKLVDIVRFIDPDILTGYEIHGNSWGYVIERARELYDYNLCDEISRVRSQAHGMFGRENDRWGFEHSCSVRITGRNIINIWRAMRSELTLQQYTMENVVFNLFKKRIPHYHFQDLTSWFKSNIPRHKAKVAKYFAERACLDLKILAANETISRTQEQARILGIDFASVILRGSQFKVESLLFRIAKPESYMLVSPSREQVGQENALEIQPLIMEPQSALYTSPVLVMDFQSLYPSVVIAYNYCYSTCLGRINRWRGRNKLGFVDLDVDPRLLALLEQHVNIAPNGILYSKPDVRQSLLSRMLSEILETRVMVKNSMKEDKDNKALQRLLNNRQLALKFIANVTYGYTSAAFSGRMPCVEIADSIVSTGRETLEKAIALIHSVERWGAEVVYGDTDSLFIHLKGRTRDEAFVIGNEIAKAVTNANPRPVKLKFEKVYHPCLLQSKKRYVGYKYESPEQKEPIFDAKGIETVRRDGTPLQQTTVERVLRILFETADLSLVKEYFQERCAAVLSGDLPLSDFIFAKEVKLGKYSSESSAPPGALVSAQRMLQDRRLEPQYGERVPYVVVTAEPHTNLKLRCVAPEVFLSNPEMSLDAEYYIKKNIIPSLARILDLVGADVKQWFDSMSIIQLPRKNITPARIDANQKTSNESESRAAADSTTLWKSATCLVCQDEMKRESSAGQICGVCWKARHASLLRLNMRLRDVEKRTAQLQAISRSYMAVPFGDQTKCDSMDSPAFYARMKAEYELNMLHAQLESAMNDLGSAEEEQLEW